MDKIRLGIIGVGNMGTSHFNNCRNIEGMDVTAVCDIDPNRIKDMEVKKFSDSRELIRSGLVDAVLVSTPHYDHTTIGIDVLENGLHLLVEKPISVTMTDAERLIRAHKDKTKKFAAMFNQRTNPAFIKIKEMINTGELGEIRRVSWIITDWFRTEAYYASGGWRATWKGEGGGVLINQCPHNIDLFQWFIGMPDKVIANANLGKFHNIEVEDEVTALFEYQSGVTGVFIASTGEAPGTNRLEITAENGKVVFESQKITFTKNKVPMSQFCKTDKGSFRTPEKEVIEYGFDSVGEQHVGILKNFRDAILKNEPLIAPAEEGIKSVMLANAMLMSGLTKKPVSIPNDLKKFPSILEKLKKKSRYVKPEIKPAVVQDMSSSFK